MLKGRVQSVSVSGSSSGKVTLCPDFSSGVLNCSSLAKVPCRHAKPLLIKGQNLFDTPHFIKTRYGEGRGRERIQRKERSVSQARICVFTSR